MRNPCDIPFQTLLDWHEGRLTAEAAANVRQHVDAGCARCRENLQWMAEVLPAIGEAVMPPPVPSANALAYANSLARLLLPVGENAGAFATVKRHIAHLVDGTRPRPLATVGARGGTAPAVQRVFETDAHVISLWDEPEEGDKRYLIGQIYTRGGDAATAVPFRVVALLPSGNGVQKEAEREGNEFHFAGVAPGVYLVRCLLETDEVFLPQVAVGQA